MVIESTLKDFKQYIHQYRKTPLYKKFIQVKEDLNETLLNTTIVNKEHQFLTMEDFEEYLK